MTGKSGFRVLVACAATAALSVAMGQQPPMVPQPAKSAASPDAAEVRSVPQLRKDLRKAEDRFNALYNKLNPRRDEHVICEESADTGTRLAKRRCGTVGEREAVAQDALDYVATMTESAALAGQAGNAANRSSPADAAVAAATAGHASTTDNNYSASHKGSEVESRRETYRRNLEKLLAEHADLRQALQEYNQAYRRHEDALRRQNTR